MWTDSEGTKEKKVEEIGHQKAYEEKQQLELRACNGKPDQRSGALSEVSQVATW